MTLLIFFFFFFFFFYFFYFLKTFLTLFTFLIFFYFLPHILPQILPQTTTSIAIYPPTTFLYLRETQANVLRGLQRFWGGCKVLYLRETEANVCWLLVFSMPAEIFYFLFQNCEPRCRMDAKIWQESRRNRSGTDNLVLAFWCVF